MSFIRYYCIFRATNVYLTLRESIKLLIIEYQKGHTSYEKRAHFLVFKKVEGHRAPVPPACSAVPDVYWGEPERAPLLCG